MIVGEKWLCLDDNKCTAFDFDGCAGAGKCIKGRCVTYRDKRCEPMSFDPRACATRTGQRCFRRMRFDDIDYDGPEGAPTAPASRTGARSTARRSTRPNSTSGGIRATDGGQAIAAGRRRSGVRRRRARAVAPRDARQPAEVGGTTTRRRRLKIIKKYIAPT